MKRFAEEWSESRKINEKIQAKIEWMRRQGMNGARRSITSGR